MLAKKRITQKAAKHQGWRKRMDRDDASRRNISLRASTRDRASPQQGASECFGDREARPNCRLSLEQADGAGDAFGSPLFWNRRHLDQGRHQLRSCVLLLPLRARADQRVGAGLKGRSY